jgi:hypothetical protein
VAKPYSHKISMGYNEIVQSGREEYERTQYKHKIKIIIKQNKIKHREIQVS